jgi:hypothetical protein
MNWKVLGTTLTVLAICSGTAGLCAGAIADNSIGVEEKAREAVKCFDGYYDACRLSREQDHFIARWKDYGTEIAIGSGFILLIGVSILAASWLGAESRISTVNAEPDDDAMSEDEVAEAEAFRRELFLRGVRVE